jgi:uridylate kinase
MPTPPPTGRSPYHRVLLKLSGESLGGEGVAGLNAVEINSIAQEIKLAHASGAQISIVVGGGNFIRGADLAKKVGIDQVTADQMGMLATIINAMALREALQAAGMQSRVMSAVEVKQVAEPYLRLRAVRHLEKGRIVILAGGTGNPLFTTDTCAALRASELQCQAILKGTKVDGIYTADPKKDPKATRYEHVTYTEAMTQNLKVMDMAAFDLCRQQKIPIVVFDYRVPGNIRRAITGEKIGTLVSAEVG